MPIGKKLKPEQIIRILRYTEVEMAQGKSVSEVCKSHGLSTKSFYRWRKEYGGMRVEQAKKLKDLEKENNQLKRLVADLSLDNSILNVVSLIGHKSGI